MSRKTGRAVKTPHGILLHPQDFVYVQMEGAKRPEMAHVMQIMSTNGEGRGKRKSNAVKVHWLYRPLQEVPDEDLDCAPFPGTHVAELFYSFHEDILPLDAVLQTIVVYCIPKDQEFEKEGMRRVPGYFCKRVYSKESGRHALHWLTDKDYNSKSQRVVNALLERTRQLQKEGRLHTLKRGKIAEANTPPLVIDLLEGDEDREVLDKIPKLARSERAQPQEESKIRRATEKKDPEESPRLGDGGRSNDNATTSATEVKKLQKKVASWLEKIVNEPNEEVLEEASVALPRWASKLHDCLQDEHAPFYLSSVWKIASAVREIKERKVKMIVASSMIPTILGEWAFALVDGMDQPNGYKAFVLCCEAVLRLPVQLLPQQNMKIAQLQKCLRRLVQEANDDTVIELSTQLLKKSFR
mmetsp:Transcript_10795/g.66666  ORF Transcript_10795/g.66666 Transcript_10795/m.66666 type:complete len:412 (+) Transcript_10795:2500-3735(+)